MASAQQQSGPAAGRRLPRVALVGIVATVVVVLVAGLLIARQVLGPDQSSVQAQVNLGARVEISPAAAFLSDVGQSRQLTAHAFDGAGDTSDGAATWSSSHPENVDVAADGTITAKALGSSTISAVVDGVTSAPVLVVVARPAAGVTLVSDEQIVGQIEPTDPDAEPAFDNTYRVTLTGVTPEVGDLLGGTGEKPLAGRVTAVDGATVTLRQVPLAELVPNLAIDEVIDLSHARIVIPDEVARLYDVSRNGDTFDFTPKANFNELLPAVSMIGAQMAMAGGLPDRAQLLRAAGGAQGTSALPPFSKCEGSFTPSSEASPLSLEGSSPPEFSFDVDPTATILFTEENGFEKLIVGSTFKVTAKATLKIAAAFEGKYGCEIELWKFIFPAPGLLALALGAIIPIKAGFEIGGKLTVTSIELGAEASAATGLELGVARPPGGSSSIVNTMADVTTTWTPKVDGPSWTDVRLEPALEVFGAAEVLIGPPYLDQFQLNMLRAKAGAKLAADWAPQPVQIADKAYASNYGLALEAGIKAGPELTDIAAMLGLGDIASAEFNMEPISLAQSPTGKVTFDRAGYLTGDSGVAKVVMDPASVEFMSLYNVERLLLVQHLPGEERVIATSASAAEGQRDFELSFTATGPLSASDLYVFVVTKFPALEFFGLELGKGRGNRIAYAKGTDIYTMAPDGSDQRLVTTNGSAPISGSTPKISPDGTKIAFVSARDGNVDIYVVNADGSGLTNITRSSTVDGYPAWSPDGTNIAFIRIVPRSGAGVTTQQYPQVYVMNSGGGAMRQVTNGSGGSTAGAFTPSWSPDGTQIAFGGIAIDSTGRGSTGICMVAASGGPDACFNLQLASGIAPAWSPDGMRLAFRIEQYRGEETIVHEWGGVAVIALGGGAPVRVAEDGEFPAWSPDGTQIAFVINGDIYSSAADGTDIKQLTNTPERESSPTWGGG